MEKIKGIKLRVDESKKEKKDNELDLEKYIRGMEKDSFIGDIMKLIEANNNGKIC